MSSRRSRIQLSTATPDAEAPTKPVARRDFLARTAAAFGAGMLALAGRPALPGGDQARAATAASEPYIGEIMMFAGNFPPNGWAFCDGQLLSIFQNQALFSLLGTYYGGDGQTTFALPDLRGRLPMHTGSGPGPGLSPRSLGESGGVETVTLAATQMPAHTHSLQIDNANGTTSSPVGALLARDPAGTPAYGVNANGALSAQAVASAGGSQAHQNMPPFLAINYCIALQGIYPPQS
jgi:microcystin-dependent protein